MYERLESFDISLTKFRVVIKVEQFPPTSHMCSLKKHHFLKSINLAEIVNSSHKC